jgi:DNA polymerase-3 subunit epsilon
VGKSVSVRSRARAHFCAPAGWTERADVVDYRPTMSELGALVLENRLIKQWRPPGNRQLKRTDSYVYLRCRLDIAYPVLEVAGQPAAGHAVNVGPLRPRGAAQELADQLGSLFQLRHCGRKLKLREHPSLYGQMGRCLSPCLNDLDPNLYRRRLDEALGVFQGPQDAGVALLRRIEEQMRTASDECLYERAAVLRDRHERLGQLLERLGGVLEATHRRSQLVLARHPAKDRFDALWVVAGRVRDWGPLPGASELVERTRSVIAAEPAARPRTVTADEVDEVRIVTSWVEANDPPRLDLDRGLEPRSLVNWVRAAAG